jgi:uncharacterized protein YxjI
MHSYLNKNLFFVKEFVGMFKAANEFDIFDPETQEMIIQCREPKLGGFTKFLRFTDYKRMTPFELVVTAKDGQKLLTVKRGVAIFLSKVEVLDENDRLIGYFKQHFFSLGGAFTLYDANDRELCKLKGKWTGWDFKFIAGNEEFAHITKKWAGLGKELFTSADNYVIAVSDKVPADNQLRPLILASVLCIDMVLKE